MSENENQNTLQALGTPNFEHNTSTVLHKNWRYSNITLYKQSG